MAKKESIVLEAIDDRVLALLLELEVLHPVAKGSLIPLILRRGSEFSGPFLSAELETKEMGFRDPPRFAKPHNPWVVYYVSDGLPDEGSRTVCYSYKNALATFRETEVVADGNECAQCVLTRAHRQVAEQHSAFCDQMAKVAVRHLSQALNFLTREEE